MKKRILVIDDEEILIRTMNRLLEKTGYEVFSVKNGADAEILLEEQEIDLIISDIHMPGRNGVESMKRLVGKAKKIYGRDIPFIFITGFTDQKIKKQAKALGSRAYLMKPFDLVKLMDVIESSVETDFAKP